MADAKTVRGTVAGAVVETTAENADRLGSAFEPATPKAPAKKASSSKSSK